MPPIARLQPRLYSNQATGLLATAPLTVTTCTGVTLGVSPTCGNTGATLTANWSGICSDIVGASNQIRLFAMGAPDGQELSWRATTGTASGNLAYTLPTTLAPGGYELRLFTSGNQGRLATAPFTVTAGGAQPPADALAPSNIVAALLPPDVTRLRVLLVPPPATLRDP